MFVDNDDDDDDDDVVDDDGGDAVEGEDEKLDFFDFLLVPPDFFCGLLLFVFLFLGVVLGFSFFFCTALCVERSDSEVKFIRGWSRF